MFSPAEGLPICFTRPLDCMLLYLYGHMLVFFMLSMLHVKLRNGAKILSAASWHMPHSQQRLKISFDARVPAVTLE